MANPDLTDADAKSQMFDQLGNVRAGMLGVLDSGQHLQPMAPYPDRDAGLIWFITSRQTDLVRAVGMGATAHFAFTSKDEDYYACLRGSIAQVDDEGKIDEIWTAVAAAWFKEGRDDHDVCLLRLTLQDASIWASRNNPVTFAFEIARANMTHDTAELGVHRVLDWRLA